MNAETPRWVTIARLLRARGNKGEVAAELLTDFPERLKGIREVYVGGVAGNAEPRAVALTNFWLNQNHPGQAVFHFAGCDSIDAAEKFRGLGIFLPIEQRVTLPAGQYFVSDLIGCSVFENPGAPPVVSSSPCSLAEVPALLGTVRDVQFLGEGVAGTPLLEVETSSGEILIPLAEDVCTKIDTGARRIDVLLPTGLRDLNRE